MLENAGVKPCPPTVSHRSRGSMYKRNMRGERVSPWMVPLPMWMGAVRNPEVLLMMTEVDAP